MRSRVIPFEHIRFPRGMGRLSAVLIILMATGCASKHGVTVRLSALQSASYPGAAAAGGWTLDHGAITNTPPPHLASRRPPESLSLEKGFEARDLEARCRLTIAPGATAGLVFRAQRDHGVVSSMYALVVYIHGVNLWRLLRGRWGILARYGQVVEPGTPHVLRAEVRGDKMSVYFDGKKLFEGEDQLLPMKGGAGIYARAGRSRFESVTFRSLDREPSKRESKK